MSDACGRCGKDPADGFATIGDTRFCHGDSTYPEPTCYMLGLPTDKPNHWTTSLDSGLMEQWGYTDG